MPKRRRINISVYDEVYEALEGLSAQRDQPVADVSLSLIKQGLRGG